MKKVLIIGGGGLLGSALAKEFSAGYLFVGLNREQFDITDEQNIREKLLSVAPGLIINAAAYNGVDLTEKEEASYALAEEVNGFAVGRLADFAADRGIPLVHFSTDYVFDGDNLDGYAEGATPSPLNKYGYTKFLGERLLQENTARYYLIRLSRLFGRPGTSVQAKKSFVDIVIDLVENQGKKELKLVNEEVSSPTYSVDLARLVRQLLDEQYPYGIYHGANSGGCSWYEMAEKIFELKKLSVNLIPVTSKEYPRPAKRPPHSVLLNTKLPPARPWQEALAEYVA